MPTESAPSREEKPPGFPRIVYAGDRDISVRVLDFLIESSFKPMALLVPDWGRATHAGELATLASYLPPQNILRGTEFKSKAGVELLKGLHPDYIISIHFPYIFPKEVLEIPRCGTINLHPAYLPCNRGWHTPTWAIQEGTPYGATLHFVSEEVDAGDIILQRRIEVKPDDTADSLYKRVKRLEFLVFKEAWPLIVNGTYQRKPQNLAEGTLHKKEDIIKLQWIDLNEQTTAADLIKRLRALTTNTIEEAAYFEVAGGKYRIRVRIKKE